jgi:hypothetical protein
VISSKMKDANGNQSKKRADILPSTVAIRPSKSNRLSVGHNANFSPRNQRFTEHTSAACGG